MTQEQKTVLIVEDSQIQATALAQVLRKQGLRVIKASNGRIGVETAIQQVPDVIVLDLKMPEMDGFEACKQLQEDPRTQDVPIVMLTASEEPDAILRGLELGAIDFIPKDAFSFRVLLETLRQLDILEEEAEPATREGK